MGGGVDQAEVRVRHRECLLMIESLVEALELGGPEIDVLPLEGADLVPRGGGQRLPIPILYDDQGKMSQREVNVPINQGLDRLGSVDRGGDPMLTFGEQHLADRDQHRGEHRVLGLEMLVERRPTDSAGPAEIADRDTMEAPRGEEFGRGLEDLFSTSHPLRLAVVNALWTPPAAPTRVVNDH